MRHKKALPFVLKLARLCLATVLLLLSSGGISAATTQDPQVQVMPVQDALPDAPAGIPVCRSRIYLPLVMRDAAGSVQSPGGPAGGGLAEALPLRTLHAVSSPEDGSLGLSVAYLYDGDLPDARAFRALLADYGLRGYPWPKDRLDGASFADCDLILVGSDTGPWTDAAARNAVLDAGLPVGALGGGGMDFLDAASVLTGLVSGSSSATTVVAIPRALELFRFPNDIPLPPDKSLPLYTTASTAYWLDQATPLPDGIEIGHLPGTTQHPIVQPKRRFLLWGFDDGPAGMTPVGRDLFVNSLVFQTKGLRLPFRSRQFVPQSGVEKAFLEGLDAAPGAGLHALIQLRLPPGDPACADLANLAPVGVTDLYQVYRMSRVAFVGKSFDPGHPLIPACLRWVGRLLPEDRAHPTILAGAYPDWADNGDGTVNLLARFMPDVPDSAAVGILDGLGATHAVHTTKTWAIVIDKAQVPALTQEDALRWLRAGPSPGVPLNDEARQYLYVDDVQDATISGGTITYGGLTGNGVTVGVFDNGMDASHPDLSARMLTSPGVDDHGTHTTGIVGASGGLSASAGGTDFQWRGMAPEVTLAGYIFHWEGWQMAQGIDSHDMVISNHSYKMACSDYTADVEDTDDLVRGDYDYLGNVLDPHLAVWSAGNQGSGAQHCEQVEDDPTTGPRGFYSVLAPAKNVVTVGALADNWDHELRGSSSRGPTLDGRLKPDVMATGCMHSTVANLWQDDNGNDCDGLGDDYCYPYDRMCGTSMASPAVAGVAALMTEQYRDTYLGENLRPPPEGLKALLINSATDLVQDPDDPTYSAYGWDCPDMGEPVIYHQGPDYSTGYGAVHARRATEAVAHKDLLISDISDDSDVDEYTFEVLDDRQEIRVTLAWSDPAGEPLLSDTALQLVNDLDLALIDPAGSWHYPFILNSLPAAADHYDGSLDPISQSDIEAAYRGMDHSNNVEQVVLWKDDPTSYFWEGTWTVRVSATDLCTGCQPQDYALVGEWREISLEDIYPVAAGYYLAPDVVILPVHVQNPHAVQPAAAGGISADHWQVRIGEDSTNTWTDATVEAAYGPTGDQAYLVVRPPDTLAAGILYDIEVTLLDAYQIDERETEAFEPIDRVTRTDAVIYTAEPRAPIDEVIVMDNSGSMADYGKLESAQNAARAFADRRQADDMIGLANFRSTASTLYPLTLVSTGETELDDVKTEIDAMYADGGTALGSGMLEGKDELETSGAADHTWNMILLSDGLENVPPCWDTSAGNPKCEGQTSVQPDFVSSDGCPTIEVDTVAIGPEDASWRELMDDIADKTCGEAWHATLDESSSAAEGRAAEDALFTPLVFPLSFANTLADIYITIADGNTLQERLWEQAGTLALDEVVTHSVDLEGGLPEVTFAINWPDAASPIPVALFRPSGPLANPGDADVHHKTDGTHVIYRIDGPAKGEWKLQVGGEQGTPANEFLAVASANTDVTMLLDFGLPPERRRPGASMPIYVVVADHVGVITGANVQVNIQRPGSAIHNLTMYDDGSHGDGKAGDGVYTNEYPIPVPGNYKVKARALGTAHGGESFARHRLRHFRASIKAQVAYVWDTDSATMNDYRILLEGNGLTVVPVRLADVTSTDLSPFHLILVGPDTGQEAIWGDAARVTHIASSGKPVLGLGDGGHAYFGKLALAIGYANGADRTDADVLAVDSTHDIWRMPYDIAMGGAGTLAAVYSGTGSDGVAMNLDQIPADVEVLAQRPSEAGFYWLAREKNRFLLWGFNEGPVGMTTEGKELFVNTAYYAFP